MLPVLRVRIMAKITSHANAAFITPWYRCINIQCNFGQNSNHPVQVTQISFFENEKRRFTLTMLSCSKGTFQLSDVAEHSKAWRHIRGVVRRTFIMGDVMPYNWVSLWSWLPLQLLGAYLWNRMVDFAHFWQANWYGWLHLTYKNSLPSDLYLRF